MTHKIKILTLILTLIVIPALFLLWRSRGVESTG